MQKKLLIGLATVLFVFGMAGIASATLYTYDFGSMGYAEGTNFENRTIDAATFTSEAGDLHYTDNCGAGIFNGYGATGDIYISFSEPVDWLSFTAGDGGGDYDAFAVSLYEFDTNNFIGTWNSDVFGGSNEPEWFTLNISMSNIGSISFDPANSGILPGELGPPAVGGVILTNFSYNTETTPVPEPATMLLFGTGLTGLVGSRIRRKKK